MNKRERTRLARAEILMQLAMTAQRWADEVADRSGTTRPVAEWPADDPMVRLMRTYDLSQYDLDRLLTAIAQQIENRSLASGFDEVILDDMPALAASPR